MDLSLFQEQSQRARPRNRAFIDRLKKKPPGDLDERFRQLHDDAFEHTDCLACANCCKTTSPIFYERDINRAAARLKTTPGRFIDTYLRIDEEGDYVFRSAPCPFLQADNRCAIYESRPAACREYPHTNRKRMHQVLDLTFRNTLVCPAVLRIVTRLQEER